MEFNTHIEETITFRVKAELESIDLPVESVRSMNEFGESYLGFLKNSMSRLPERCMKNTLHEYHGLCSRLNSEILDRTGRNHTSLTTYYNTVAINIQ